MTGWAWLLLVALCFGGAIWYFSGLLSGDD